MDVLFRLARQEDLAQMQPLFAQASHFLHSQGVNQWQNGYPSLQLLQQDIAKGQSYLLFAGGKLAAVAVLQTLPEKTYEKIYEGGWHSGQKAACIHRIAISQGLRGSGIGGTLMQKLVQTAKAAGFANLRVDTHEDNQPMQKYLKKHGFEYCGIIYLADGAKRIAFDKTI